MTGEINITYETLFELLRIEKSRGELQKLDSDFFKDVLNYIKEKKESVESLKDKTDLFAADERQKAEKQLQNVKKIIKDIYERREKKIIEAALDSSRMFSGVIDRSALLEEEKKLFDSVLEVLNNFRKGILFSLIEAKQIDIKNEKTEEKAEEERKHTDTEKKQTEEVKKETMMIRFLHPVPKFIGKSLEEYGPFDKEDVANIPSELAELLVKKERAETIE